MASAACQLRGGRIGSESSAPLPLAITVKQLTLYVPLRFVNDLACFYDWLVRLGVAWFIVREFDQVECREKLWMR